MRYHAVVLGVTLVLAVSTSPETVQAQTDDHLKCYLVKDDLVLKPPAPPAPKEFLDLTGPQFGSADCKIVGGFRLLCVPVTKTVTELPRRKFLSIGGTPQTFTPDPQPGITQADQICYKIKCPDEVLPPDPGVRDQFGERTVEFKKPFMVCGPAQKGCGDTLAPVCDGFCTQGENCIDSGGVCSCVSCDQNGAYLSAPSVSSTCAFGAVNFSVFQWIFSDLGGGSIQIDNDGGHFGPMLGTSSDCPAGSFSASVTIPGDCSETYSLTGQFTGQNTWTATFSATYAGGANCLDCISFSVPVTGTK
jgi:hypothetical protein